MVVFITVFFHSGRGTIWQIPRLSWPGLGPKPVPGTIVHVSDVLQPETVRQGEFVRSDMPHSRNPTNRLNPQHLEPTFLVSIDLIKRRGLATADEESMKKPKYDDDGNDPVSMWVVTSKRRGHFITLKRSCSSQYDWKNSEGTGTNKEDSPSDSHASDLRLKRSRPTNKTLATIETWS
ncbi:hypothetical protein F5051DRAFT_434290 [Lentinula edodes]|nr:hypothetical protein F5051DRAFT_434290 [Lentinula edodes]